MENKSCRGSLGFDERELRNNGDEDTKGDRRDSNPRHSEPQSDALTN